MKLCATRTWGNWFHSPQWLIWDDLWLHPLHTPGSEEWKTLKNGWAPLSPIWTDFSWIYLTEPWGSWGKIQKENPSAGGCRPPLTAACCCHVCYVCQFLIFMASQLTDPGLSAWAADFWMLTPWKIEICLLRTFWRRVYDGKWWCSCFFPWVIWRWCQLSGKDSGVHWVTASMLRPTHAKGHKVRLFQRFLVRYYMIWFIQFSRRSRMFHDFSPLFQILPYPSPNFCRGSRGRFSPGQFGCSPEVIFPLWTKWLVSWRGAWPFRTASPPWSDLQMAKKCMIIYDTA
jgi:hypothetical protein